MVVKVEKIENLRPRIDDEFTSMPFKPRTKNITVAYEWGQEIHKGQKRFSGEPYFETHCAWVGAFLDNLIGNEAWTIAGLLHDSIEDHGGSLDRIKKKFPGALGEEVAYLVDGVTKLSHPRDGRSRELETLRKIAMFRDPGVFLVKLADKSHNIMTLEHMGQPKRQQKAVEAIRAYGKLAGILNCYRWRRWLEDMAFPHADPETYAFVKERIDRDPRLQVEFINPLIEKLANVMVKAGVQGDVKITVNGYWQSWQKLRRMARARKTSMNTFSAVNDIISFRLIVEDNDPRACYELLSHVNRFFGPYLDQDRFDDYIAFPQNGYQALQITSWMPDYGACEVAIANADMEGENLWGVVYAIQNGKDISSYRPVEILTPTGGARFVPEGSTVLDAVASIQQEFLLDKISAVEVNGGLAKLSDKVKPGDVVEVITEKGRLQPSEKWLDYSNASTSRVLRIVLAVEAIKTAAEEGRNLIKPILTERGILDLEDVRVLENDKLDNLLETLASSSLEDLYSAIGSGAIRLQDLACAMDDLGISKADLCWTTIYIRNSAKGNRPGVLARFAGKVSESGGNIVRSVNNTTSSRGFVLRLVVEGLDKDAEEKLKSDLENCEETIEELELV
ncbi:MAG: HD domain-containing protein [Anaerolineaceae bacterium]|nr:HD domain-containing protein [Anaerolineaceae bacterium]